MNTFDEKKFKGATEKWQADDAHAKSLVRYKEHFKAI